MKRSSDKKTHQDCESKLDGRGALVPSKSIRRIEVDVWTFHKPLDQSQVALLTRHMEQHIAFVIARIHRTPGRHECIDELAQCRYSTWSPEVRGSAPESTTSANVPSRTHNDDMWRKWAPALATKQKSGDTPVYCIDHQHNCTHDEREFAYE
jgi:hypothetical protein